LENVCFKPLEPEREECMILSVLGWWQDDLKKLEHVQTTESGQAGENYLDHFTFCTDNNYASSCFGPYGGPVSPSIVLGGYTQTKEGQQPDYKSATTVMVSYFVKDFVEKEKNVGALEWELAFINFLKNFTTNDPLARDVLDVKFTSARSIEDEIQAASRGEVHDAIIIFMVFCLIH
jgi:Niemann-Pick C1 protein